MRLICLLFCFVCSQSLFSQDKDPVLFTVGNDEVNVSEFKYIYEKNNSDKADYSKKSIEEYLDLYKNFKLKVHRAKANGLDTVPALQKELAGYRKQLAKSYLKDKEIADRLISEVTERMKEDIQVSHIFVAASPTATTSEVTMAEEKIQSIYDKVSSYKDPIGMFKKIAMTSSEDKISAQKSGSLGYYTAPLPDGFYEFENAMYNTAVNNFSEPVRSKMGFHILYISDKREARGEMEISHVLIRKNEVSKLNNHRKVLVDSIYSMLQAGKNFETLAKQYSEDKKTKDRGGYLGYFAINQYEKSFEDAAFALSNNGDYSQPISTKIGFHIIKRISLRDNSNPEILKKRIEARINNNDRFKIAEEKLLADVKKEAGFSENRGVLGQFIGKLDDKFYSYKWTMPKMDTDPVLMNIGGRNITIKDFGKYIKKNVRDRLKFAKETPLEIAATQLYTQYVNEEVMAYEEANLEKKYPDFKALMREYNEGILLFEITKEEVWDKASQDTVGLQNFYSNKEGNYSWPKRAKAVRITMESNDAAKIQEAYAYQKKKGTKKFLKKYKNNKQVTMTSESLLLITDSAELKGMELKKGAVSPLATTPTATFLAFEEIVPPSNKTLQEAKGYVIADYQDFLEKEWIAKLKKDYPIVVKDKALSALIK